MQHIDGLFIPDGVDGAVDVTIEVLDDFQNRRSPETPTAHCQSMPIRA